MMTTAPPWRPTGRWIFRGRGLPGLSSKGLRTGIIAGAGCLIFFLSAAQSQAQGSVILLSNNTTSDQVHSASPSVVAGVTNFIYKASPGGLTLNGEITGGDSSSVLYFNTSTAGDNATPFTLSGANTFRANIRINRGRLIVNHANALGNTANEVFLNSNTNLTDGNLTFNLSGTFANPIRNDSSYDNTIGTLANDVVLTGNIYGSGSLTKLGSGKLTITGNNTYSNGTTISAGTLEVGNGGSGGTLGSGAVNNNGTLVFNRSNSFTNANAISGPGSVRQIGSGTTVLSGFNTYSGTTTISNGTLRVSGSIEGSTLIESGGTLDVTGTVSAASVGPVTVKAGGQVRGTGQISSLSVQSNGVVKIQTAATNATGAWYTAGTITFDPGSAIDVSGLSLTQTSYTLIRGSSVSGTPKLRGGGGFTVANTNDTITLTAIATTSQVFGSGTNQFTMEFVTVGNPGNPADTVGSPNPTGAVAYRYNLGKYEVSRDMILKANAASGLGITLQDMSSYGGNSVNRPASGISWLEAAIFVNWLNTSQGHSPAYKFDGSGNIQLWTSADAGYQAGNPFRNSLARYWLPSTDEWYKGAFGSPDGTWSIYPTASNSAPLSRTNGTISGSAVYGIGMSIGPADITNAGGLSAFGTMAQGGNVLEWTETSLSGTNNNATNTRERRGGSWFSATNNLANTDRTGSGVTATDATFGFRVASVVPKPIPTVTVTPGSYIYNGGPQGPGIAQTDKGGSGGNVTLEYTGNSVAYGPTNIPPTNAGLYTVVAKVAEDANYSQGQGSAGFEIARGTPELSSVSASPILEGSSLSASTITGTAKNSVGGNVPGTWNFQYGSTPALGTSSHFFVFQPNDSNNYYSKGDYVNVSVYSDALDTDSDGFNDWVEVSAGTDPNSATSRPTSSSRLLVWGETPFATNAVMATGVTQAVLAQVSTATNVIAVLKDGGVTTWSLTGSSLSAYTTPTNATSNVLMIAAGDEHILALKNNGQVVAWGMGFSNNSTDPEWGQSMVPAAATSGIVAIAAGGYHSLALRGDGRVVAWGRNNYQQTDVPSAASNGVVAIAAGYYTSFALKSDGTLVGWGRGSYGATVPSDALSGVVAISAGRNHAMALKTNGIVKAWGSPPSSQVTTSTGAPVGLNGVTEISAGRYYSMALKSDRTLLAWGETTYTNDPFLTPSNLANVNFIQGGRNHGLAIVSDSPAPRLDLPMAPIQIQQGASTNLTLKSAVSSPTFSQLGLPVGVTLSSGGALTAASNATVTNAFVRIIVANSNGSDARVVNLQVTSGDTNPPTITLNGNPLVLLETKDSYTDVGVTVTDNVDSSIVPTAELTGAGILYPTFYDDSFWLTDGVGSYTITYRAQDAAGNQATPVTRTVKVFPNDYLAWAASYGLFGANVPDLSGDEDADGFDSDAEFRVYTDPKLATSNPKPVIQNQPAAGTKAFGDTFVFTPVVATNYGPFTFQWRKDGSFLSGETNASLSLSNLKLADAGNYTVVVANSYGSTTSSIASLSVGQATPSIIWTNPAAITYGAALTTNQLNASSGVMGSFTYSPSNGVILNAGTNTLTAVFRATDTTNYVSPVTNTVSLVVNKASNSIGLAATDAKAFGANPYALVFTKSSTGALSYTSTVSGVATISSNGMVTIRGAGQTVLKVSQAGDANYEPAPEVSQVLTVTSTGTAISSGSGTTTSGGITSANPSSAAPILNLPATLTYGQKISLPGAVQGVRVGESGLNMAIPNYNPGGFTRQLTLSGLDLSSYRLTVGLRIDGTQDGAYLGDYEVYLRHNAPGDLIGQTRYLLDRAGKTPSDPTGAMANGINAIFSDTALSNVQNVSPSDSAQLTGTFKIASLLPTWGDSSTAGGLNTLGGGSWNGTWTLWVADLGQGSTGNLVDWFMQFEDVSQSSPTANTSNGLIYEVVDSPTFEDDGTNKANISGNELTATSGSGRITIRAAYPGGSNWTTNTITLQAATQTITFTNRPVTVVSNQPYPFDPGATVLGGDIVYLSDNTNVAVGGTNGVRIVGAGVARLSASSPGDANYGSASGTNQVLTVLAPPSALPFREDFSSFGFSRLMPIAYNGTNPLSLAPESYLANTNGRLTFFSPRASAAIAQPNLTLPLTNSWTIEATVNVPSSSTFHSVGFNIMRDLYQGGQYSPNDQLTLHYYSAGGNRIVRSYQLTQSGGYTNLATNLSSVSTLRLAMRYDHLTKEVSFLYRDSTNSPWQTNGVRSLATNGTIGATWGLKETDLFRVGFFGETWNSTGTAGADLSLDDIYVQVQTLPELTLSGTLTGKVDEALSGGYPVLFTGHPSITFTASNLPAGLAIGTNGIITGTPTAGGSGTATIYASNSYGVVSTNLAFNIARAASTVTVTGNTSFTYNGSGQGPTGVSRTGSWGAVSVSYEGVSPTVYASSTNRPVNAGSYQAVATLPGDSNYEGAISSAFGFTITKASPTITVAPTASAITYGQTLANSTLSGGTASVTGSFAFTVPTTPPNAGTAGQGVTFTPEDTANYNTVTTNLPVTVNRAFLTITGLSGKNKAYDGTKAAEVDGTASLSGRVLSDGLSDVSLTGSLSFEFLDANVGTDKPITVSGGSLSGSKAENYQLSLPTNLKANIVAAGLPAVTFAPPSSLIYDGTAKTHSASATGPSSLNLSYSGRAGTSYGPSGTAPSRVGDYTVTATTSDNNYSGSRFQEFSITRKGLTISGASAVNRAYNGGTNVVVSGGSLVGVESGDTVTLNSSGAAGTVASADAGSGKAVTVTGYAIGGGDAGNYSLSQPNGVTVDISKASQTIAFILAQTSVLSSVTTTNLTANATSGLTVSFESSSASVATVSGNTMTIVGPGTVTITAKQAGNGNYEAATDVPQILTVVDVDLPIAGADSETAAPIPGEPAKYPVAKLLLNDRPSANLSDTRSLSITGVAATSTHGGTVTRKGNWIIYQPSTNAISAGTDSFTYTLSNGAKTATGMVNLTLTMPDFTLGINIESTQVNPNGPGMVITFAVSPGKTFAVEGKTTLSAPWRSLGNRTSETDGRLVVVDTEALPERGFYRVRWIPSP